MEKLVMNFEEKRQTLQMMLIKLLCYDNNADQTRRFDRQKTINLELGI